MGIVVCFLRNRQSLANYSHNISALGPFVSADEVIALLAQAGLFELAIDISKRFSLSMMPVFEALAARSVSGVVCVCVCVCVRERERERERENVYEKLV